MCETGPCFLQNAHNTLRPRQNGRHFAYAIFKYIFLNENVWISLKFFPKVRINSIPVGSDNDFVPTRRRSHYLDQWWFVYWCIYAPLGLNELMGCEDEVWFVFCGTEVRSIYRVVTL